VTIKNKKDPNVLYSFNPFHIMPAGSNRGKKRNTRTPFMMKRVKKPQRAKEYSRRWKKVPVITCTEF